jgi:hypothetical protein
MGLRTPSHGQTALWHIGMITATSTHIGSFASIIQHAIAVCSKHYVTSKRRLNKPSTIIAIKSFIFPFSFTGGRAGSRRSSRAEAAEEGPIFLPSASLFLDFSAGQERTGRTRLRLKAAFDSSSRRASPVQTNPLRRAATWQITVHDGMSQVHTPICTHLHAQHEWKRSYKQCGD